VPITNCIDPNNTLSGSNTDFCNQLNGAGLNRLRADQPVTALAVSPNPNIAPNLFAYVAKRFDDLYRFTLNCPVLVNATSPVTLMYAPLTPQQQAMGLLQGTVQTAAVTPAPAFVAPVCPVSVLTLQCSWLLALICIFSAMGVFAICFCIGQTCKNLRNQQNAYRKALNNPR